MSVPTSSLVAWLVAELEARQAEIEGDFADVNSGDVVIHFNRNRGTVSVETRSVRIYAGARTTGPLT